MKSIYRFWLIGLTSPVIYLVICLVVNHQVFAHRKVAGFWPLPAPVYDWLFVALAILAMACLPVVYLLKSKWAIKAPDTTKGDISVLQNPRGRRFVVAFAISDSVALIGLILFLIQGQMSAMLFFGLLGLLNYAMAYPGQPGQENDGF